MPKNLVINGNNLELDGDKLSIFGNEGFVDGESWTMNLQDGEFVEVDPTPVSQDIESVISADFIDGKLNKIHHIQMDPNTALCLYLEGRMTCKDIRDAEVTEDSIIFRAAKFNTVDGEKIFDLVVLPEMKYAHATIDENGEIV